MKNIPKHPIFVAVICLSKNAVLTLKREEDPYRDFYQLPEAPVKKGETLDEAAARVLREASGLTVVKSKLIGIHDDVYSSERRLPNLRSYIVSYLILQWTGEIPLEGVRWMSNWQSEQLAFEHGAMLLEANSVAEMAARSRLLYAVR